MGDCERGTLAVTTSEKISKNNYLQLSIPKNLVKLHAQKYITRHSQIPTQIRNVIFNFPSTGFLKKQCKLTLPHPFLYILPPILLSYLTSLQPHFYTVPAYFLTSLSGHLQLTELFNL